MEYRGRFAPSPTGTLHLGSVACAVFAAAAARRAKGKLVLRIEDLDAPRVREESEAEIIRELSWLGVEFDEGPHVGGGAGPYRQSERTGGYEDALRALSDAGPTYLCDCSRADIARAASAPHEGEEGPPYPGTCRAYGMTERQFKRPPSVRLQMPDDQVVRFRDGARGWVEESCGGVGDFVIKRADGVFSYQLACAADDVAMGITEAVRGANLATSAVRQARIARLLSGEPPMFTHLPLVVSDSGGRLAKRDGGVGLDEHRRRGVASSDVVCAIARAYGHEIRSVGDPIGALAEVLDVRRFPKSNVTVGSILGWLARGGAA